MHRHANLTAQILEQPLVGGSEGLARRARSQHEFSHQFVLRHQGQANKTLTLFEYAKGDCRKKGILFF